MSRAAQRSLRARAAPRHENGATPPLPPSAVAREHEAPPLPSKLPVTMPMTPQLVNLFEQAGVQHQMVLANALGYLEGKGFPPGSVKITFKLHGGELVLLPPDQPQEASNGTGG